LLYGTKDTSAWKAPRSLSWDWSPPLVDQHSVAIALSRKVLMFCLFVLLFWDEMLVSDLG
jgi:hypothetical protein